VTVEPEQEPEPVAIEEETPEEPEEGDQVETIEQPVEAEEEEAEIEGEPGADGLTSAERKILAGLADAHAMGLQRVARGNAGAFAGMSAGGGAFSRAATKLLQAGLISLPKPGYMAITPAGLQRTGPVRRVRSLADIHAAWKRRTKKPQTAMLDTLIAVYPNAISREDLAASVGMSATGGAFMRAVRALILLEVARYPGRGVVAATDLLFPPGLK